ncbi:MAG: glycosyltransferase family 2 protein [Spirochaetales bacterium]|nr:glycosyltransferase family 2 protein [Spirochaetales bacterium]
MNIKKIDISIVIVNWNTKKLLIDCIKSIINTTKESTYEIILVDNNSSDGSVEYIREHYKDTIIIENKENKGFACANNQGMKAARGQYICLSNSDIKILDPCLDKMKKYMDETPDAGMIAPKLLNGDYTLQNNCRNFPGLIQILLNAFFIVNKNQIPSKIFKDIHEVNAVTGAFVMVRDQALNEVGLFDERFFFYAEDIDWSKRFWNKGWKVIYFPLVRAIHYGGQSSSVAPIQYRLQMLKADIQYIEKYFSIKKQYLFYIFLIIHHFIRVFASAIVLYMNNKNRKFLTYFKKREWICLKWLIKVKILGLKEKS